MNIVSSRAARVAVFLAAWIGALSSCATVDKPRPRSSASHAAETEQATMNEDAARIAESLALPVREELPEAAREMLSGRMLKHGKQMTSLMVGVVLLDYELVEVIAESLAEEPKLGRPAAGEKGTLNAMLPASFFVHQDAMVVHAAELAQSAREGHDKKLGAAFGAVTETCVGCHSAYMRDPLNLLEDEEHDELPPSCEDDDTCEGDYR